MATTFTLKRNRKRPHRLALKGDVGIASATELHTALKELADEGALLTIDCKEATHLDGAICQLLLVSQRSWPGGSGRFQLTNASPALESHLLRTGAIDVASA